MNDEVHMTDNFVSSSLFSILSLITYDSQDDIVPLNKGSKKEH